MILEILIFIFGLIFGLGIFFLISIKTQIMDAIKQKLELKKYDREQRIQFERDAKASIQQDLMKDYAKHLRQKELDKLTGKNKSDKLKKFTNAFSMPGQNQGGQDFLSKMGMGQNNELGTINTPRNNSNFRNQESQKYSDNQRYRENPNKEPLPKYEEDFIRPTSSPGDKINQMFGIGKEDKKRSQKEEFERLRNLMK